MAGRIDAERIIKRLLAKNKETGILLHRPYPPIGLPPVRSRLGGLPSLPDGTEWPYGRSPPTGTEVPLHFLAQIDCAELPQIDARMPWEGMLFFFAREDEETIWGRPNYWADHYKTTPHDDCRVIYVRDVPKDQPVRLPPGDLRPIQDKRAGYDRVLPDEAGPSVHFAWPLLAMEFDTWPDASAFNPPLGYGYDEQVEKARIASFAAATGLTKREKEGVEWQQDIFPSKPFKGPRIPPIGSMVRQLAYEIIAEVLHRRSDATAKPLLDEARNWLARAEELQPHQTMPAADVLKFEEWLDILSQPNASDRDPPPPSERQAFHQWFEERSTLSMVRCELPAIFSRAIKRAIAVLACSPERAALIPIDLYKAVEADFLSFDGAKLRVHQMLGNAPATQEATPVSSEVLCLLRLATDDGVGMVFGDAGEAAFWIRPDDLARGHFENAWATLQGH